MIILLEATPMIINRLELKGLHKGTSNFSTIICGKCQLESFCRHLKICSGKNINRENIRNSFIMTFDLEPLQFIRDRVLYLLAHGAKAQNSA